MVKIVVKIHCTQLTDGIVRTTHVGTNWQNSVVLSRMEIMEVHHRHEPIPKELPTWKIWQCRDRSNNATSIVTGPKRQCGRATVLDQYPEISIIVSASAGISRNVKECT